MVSLEELTPLIAEGRLIFYSATFKSAFQTISKDANLDLKNSPHSPRRSEVHIFAQLHCLCFKNGRWL